MHSRRKSKRPRYRVIGGIPSVELKLRTPRQLFDERDPAPFRERDLDDDAVEYIVTSVEELKDQRDVRLSLYFESLGEFENNPGDITRAIHQYFRYEADMKRRALREMFDHGFISLAIGLTFFTLFVWTSQGAHAGQNMPLWESFWREGLHLLGWVSMWKPVSIFLHDWWPLADDVLLYRRLSKVDIEIAPLKPSAITPQAPATQPAVQQVVQPVAQPAVVAAAAQPAVVASGSVAVAIKQVTWPNVTATAKEKLERVSVPG